jgi:hypothetical protein
MRRDHRPVAKLAHMLALREADPEGRRSVDHADAAITVGFRVFGTHREFFTKR